MKYVPWWIAVILLVALIAFLATGIISGFNETVKFGVLAIVSALTGLVITAPRLSNKDSPDESTESPTT